MLNIPSTMQDPKYRYKMPKMQLKIESKGNGIKTNIVNLGDLAKKLQTDQQYILKFFGFEKASQTIFKQAGGKNNTNYIINGKFTYEELLIVLDKFIDKYILCPKCKYPQMHMIVQQNKIIGKCDSCPFVGELDNKHQLAKYIIKNPPTAKNINTGEHKTKEQNKQSKTGNIHKKKYQEQNQNHKETLQENQAQDYFSSQNMQFGSVQLKEFIIYIKKSIDECQDLEFAIKSAKIVADLKPLALKKPIMAYALFNAFFTINIAKQIGNSAKLYLRLMSKLVGPGQKTQLQTLLNLQYLILEEHKQKDLEKYVPTIMMALHQQEVFTNEFIQKWANNNIENIDKNYLYNESRDLKFKEMAVQFIKWVLFDEDDETEEKTEEKAEENT